MQTIILDPTTPETLESIRQVIAAIRGVSRIGTIARGQAKYAIVFQNASPEEAFANVLIMISLAYRNVKFSWVRYGTTRYFLAGTELVIFLREQKMMGIESKRGHHEKKTNQ